MDTRTSVIALMSGGFGNPEASRKTAGLRYCRVQDRSEGEWAIQG